MWFEGKVSWIQPKEGHAGPSPAFRIRLAENTGDELRGIIAGIRGGDVPGQWIVDASD